MLVQVALSRVLERIGIRPGDGRRGCGRARPRGRIRPSHRHRAGGVEASSIGGQPSGRGGDARLLGRRRQCVGDPGTGLVELALAAGQILDRPTLAELTIHAPLVVATPGTALQVVVSDPASDAPAVTIFGRERPDLGSWTMHAEGRLAAARTMAESKVGAPGPAAQTLPVDDVYAVLTDRGFTYGPAFQAVTAAWREGSDLVASLDVTGLDLASHVVHPVLLDAAMHVLAVGGLGAAETPDSALVPFVWSVVRVGPAARATRSPRGCPRRTAWPMPSASL